MTIEEAVAELSDLTPDEIAEKLRVAGVKGKMAWAPSCPLAHYLNKFVENGYTSVYKHVHIFEGELPNHGLAVGEEAKESIPLGESAFKFIQRFDFGVYPELIES